MRAYNRLIIAPVISYRRLSPEMKGVFRPPLAVSGQDFSNIIYAAGAPALCNNWIEPGAVADADKVVFICNIQPVFTLGLRLLGRGRQRTGGRRRGSKG